MFHPLKSQDDNCPQVPLGLSRVNAMEWVENGRVIRFGLGNNNQNPYLQSWIEWEISTDTLTSTTLTGTVEAIQLAERLELQDLFLNNDRLHLRLSPSLHSAIYTLSEPFPYTLYSTDTDQTEPRQLESLSENVSELNVLWISDNEAIIVTTPIYGGFGYDLFHICLDASCFTDISALADWVLGKPAVDLVNRRVAAYNGNASTMVIYGLDAQSIQTQIPLDMVLLHNLQPVWADDGSLLYVIGFSSNLNLALFSITIDTQEIVHVTDIQQALPEQPNDWLIAPDAQWLVFATPQLTLECY